MPFPASEPTLRSTFLPLGRPYSHRGNHSGAPDGKIGGIAEVNYTKNKAEVHREVAITSLRGQGDSSGQQDLLTLNAVRHRPDWDRPRNLSELSSWVTQWDDGARQNVMPLYDTFSASGTRRPADVILYPDGRIPTIKGVIVDTINSMSGEIPAQNSRNIELAAEGCRQQHAARPRALFQPWLELCGSGGRLDSQVEYRPATENGAVRCVGRTAASVLWAYMETVSGMLFKSEKWARRSHGCVSRGRISTEGEDGRRCVGFRTREDG